MSVAYIKTAGEVYKLQEFNHVVKVIKRLTYTHHYDVGHSLTRVTRCRNNLSEKLGREKVAHLTADSRGTEAATHTATYLTRYAKRVSVLIAHKNALDTLTVVEAEKIFYRAVYF